jgi:hypothetical protein
MIHIEEVLREKTVTFILLIIIPKVIAGKIRMCLDGLGFSH